MGCNNSRIKPELFITDSQNEVPSRLSSIARGHMHQRVVFATDDISVKIPPHNAAPATHDEPVVVTTARATTTDAEATSTQHTITVDKNKLHTYAAVCRRPNQQQAAPAYGGKEEGFTFVSTRKNREAKPKGATGTRMDSHELKVTDLSLGSCLDWRRLV